MHPIAASPVPIVISFAEPMDTITVSELANRLGVSHEHTRRLIRGHRVPVILDAHGWRIRPVDARVLLSQRRTKHA
jgi:excisionase family DNA binding protein